MSICLCSERLHRMDLCHVRDIPESLFTIVGDPSVKLELLDYCCEFLTTRTIRPTMTVYSKCNLRKEEYAVRHNNDLTS